MSVTFARNFIHLSNQVKICGVTRIDVRKIPKYMMQTGKLNAKITDKERKTIKWHSSMVIVILKINLQYFMIQDMNSVTNSIKLQ